MNTKPRMRFTGTYWVCWDGSCWGVGGTMDEAWRSYHGELCYQVRSLQQSYRSQR